MAHANGGGPLLLFISGSAFLYGQIWILLSETIVYYKSTELDLRQSFKQVLIVNLASTIIVGLGFPFLLAVVTGFGMLLPPPFKEYSSALGTWVYESSPYTDAIGLIVLFGLVITFFLTMLCEAWVLSKLWARSDFRSKTSIKTLILRSHVISYAGLTLIIVYMWGGMLTSLLGM